MFVSLFLSAALLTASGQEPAPAPAVAIEAPLTEAEMAARIDSLHPRFYDLATRIRGGQPNAGHRAELRALEADLRTMQAELAVHAAAYPDSQLADFDLGPPHIAVSILDLELTTAGIPN